MYMFYLFIYDMFVYVYVLMYFSLEFIIKHV